MEQNENITFYNIMGVETNASFSEIKDAYRNLIIQHHPDKGGNKNIFQKIQDAWAVLRDSELRRKYDAEKLASDIKAFKGIVASEIPLTEFDYDENEEIYSFSCRCGDCYEIEYEDLLDGVQILSCNSCSLLLKVIYDNIVEDDAVNELEEEWAEELGV